jgi:hypothetical protein
VASWHEWPPAGRGHEQSRAAEQLPQVAEAVPVSRELQSQAVGPSGQILTISNGAKSAGTGYSCSSGAGSSRKRSGGDSKVSIVQMVQIKSADEGGANDGSEGDDNHGDNLIIDTADLTRTARGCWRRWKAAKCLPALTGSVAG